MSVRNVVVASASANKASRIQTSAVTWGCFKAEIASLLVGDVEVVVKPGNVTLRDDSSVLPEGDFSLFIIAKKNKAGISDKDAETLGTQLGKLIKEQAKKTSKDDAIVLKDALTQAIKGFFEEKVETEKSTVSAAAQSDSELDAALAEAKRM